LPAIAEAKSVAATPSFSIHSAISLKVSKVVGAPSTTPVIAALTAVEIEVSIPSTLALSASYSR